MFRRMHLVGKSTLDLPPEPWTSLNIGPVGSEWTGELVDEGSWHTPALIADAPRQAENGTSVVADLGSLTIDPTQSNS